MSEDTKPAAVSTEDKKEQTFDKLQLDEIDYKEEGTGLLFFFSPFFFLSSFFSF
jgi:hypothetical protein